MIQITDINNARHLLNRLIMFTDCGRFPRTDELAEYNIKINDVNKYFGTLNKALDAMVEYYEDPSYNLEFIYDNMELLKESNRLRNNEVTREYRLKNKDKITTYYQQYRKDNPEIIRKALANQRAVRMDWGKINPLNECFEGSHFHHLHTINSETGEVDHQVGIYMPEETHTLNRHSNKNRESMLKINELAFEFLYSQVV